MVVSQTLPSLEDASVMALALSRFSEPSSGSLFPGKDLLAAYPLAVFPGSLGPEPFQRGRTRRVFSSKAFDHSLCYSSYD
jgi:hypothetical protein